MEQSADDDAARLPIKTSFGLAYNTSIEYILCFFNTDKLLITRQSAPYNIIYFLFQTIYYQLQIGTFVDI